MDILKQYDYYTETPDLLEKANSKAYQYNSPFWLLSMIYILNNNLCENSEKIERIRESDSLLLII